MYISNKKMGLKGIVFPFITLSLLCSASTLYAADPSVVQMLKRNADTYAIDGNHGADNAQDVYLWSEDGNNINQQWIEIDRDNGYYSYQKVDTDHCLDGNGGGENAQNVYLWECRDNNYNQHWLKVDMGDGYFRLEKRNASDFSLDGRGNGEDGQSIYLWESNDNNQNQHWYFNYVNSNEDDNQEETEEQASVSLAIENAFDDGSAHASYPANNVIDDDTSFASRWAASGSPVNLTVQLGEVARVTEVGIAWGRGERIAYTFEIYARAGTSGTWTKVYDDVSSGSTADIEYVDITDIQAQQIRIKTHDNTDASDWTNITEVVLKGVDLTDNLADRSGWILESSNNSEALYNAIDDSAETRWSTTETQHNGQWLSVDFGSTQTFNTIDLDTLASANDYARGYLIYTSDNNTDWGSPIALEPGTSSEQKISFDEVTARYLKIVQTGISDDYWWSIYDLQVSYQYIEVDSKDWNVSTLSALRDALTQSGQEIVMKSGHYDLSALPSGERQLLLTGSNNTVNLEGVYIDVPVGSTTQESYIIVEGDNNHIIGGEFEDSYNDGVSAITDYIAYNEDSSFAYGLKGDAVMSISGDNNLVDGIKLTIRGSFPYGYGSLFGIGAGNSFGLNKRCGIFINGDSNTIDNSQVIQGAFCHGIYMQSPADNTTVRNTYVEGDVRASNDILAEGAGSLPYQNNYLDVDGNAIVADEMHSLSEDGIRAYNGSGSVTVENATVYKMRGGIRLYLASSANVSNSIAKDNGATNYNMPKSGTVTNSIANFTYAPVSDFRLSRSYQDLELTIEPSPNAVGAHNIADILGSNHSIILHRAGGPEDSNETRKIMVYGNNSTIVNETEYEIVLDSGTSGNKITSAGKVTDNGSNSVTTMDLVID